MMPKKDSKITKKPLTPSVVTKKDTKKVVISKDTKTESKSMGLDENLDSNKIQETSLDPIEIEKAYKAKFDQLSKAVNKFEAENDKNVKLIETLKKQNEEKDKLLKDLSTKLENSVKSNTKWKLEIENLKSENDQLKINLESKEKLIRELSSKTNSLESAMAKRNILLKSQIIQQEKRNKILLNQVKAGEVLLTEIYSQSDTLINFLEQVEKKKPEYSSHILQFVGALQNAKSRLDEANKAKSFDYATKISQDHLKLMDENTGMSNEIFKSDIKSRLEFEEVLFQIHSLMNDFSEGLLEKKYYNTASNIAFISGKLIEFMIKEGFSPEKVTKLFLKKKTNELIEKDLEKFNYLSKNLENNSEILKIVPESQRVLDEFISRHQIKNLSSLVEDFLESQNEEIQKKFERKKESMDLLEGIKKLSKLQNSIYETNKNFLTLIIIKLFDDISKIRDYVSEELKKALEEISNGFGKPFGEIYSVFERYSEDGYDAKSAISFMSVFEKYGKGLRQFYINFFETIDKFDKAKQNNFESILKALELKLDVTLKHCDL